MTNDFNPEYATVGCLLLAPRTLDEVDRWLQPADFGDNAPRLTYSVILTMASRKLPIDPVTVQAGLRRQGLLRRDGHPTMELVRMVESSITSLYFCSSEPRFSCGGAGTLRPGATRVLHRDAA